MMTSTARTALKFRKGFSTGSIIEHFFGTNDYTAIKKMSVKDLEWCLNSLANNFGELCMDAKIDARKYPCKFRNENS